MKNIVDELTEDIEPRPKENRLEANPVVDKFFRSYGGNPRTINNLEAILLCFLELFIFAITPDVKEEEQKTDE